MKIATKELNGIFQKSKRMSKFYIPFCGSNVELQKCLLSIGEEDKTSCKYLLQTTVDKRWPACLEDKIIDAQEYWTEHNNKNEYKVKLSFPKFEDNLLSASLALLLSPITKDNELLFNHICMTGDFKKHLFNFSTKAIELIKRKFVITAESFSNIYSDSHDETFAFIYVSNKDEIDEDLLKQYPWITVKRFSEETPVEDVINYLKTGLCESCESDAKANQFMDAAYQKISNYLESDLYNEANITLYVSGADNSKYVFDRRLCLNYQRFIQQKKKLSLNINCTKSLDLYDLVSDTIVQDGEAAKKLKPIWQQLLEKNHSSHIDETVERLNRINDDIENDIRSIKKFIYNQNDSQLLLDNCKIQYNQCNRVELIETTDKIISQSFYHLVLEGDKSQRKEIIVYTDSYKLYYEENIKDELRLKNQEIADLLKLFIKEPVESTKANLSKEIMNIIVEGKQDGKEPQNIIKDVAAFIKNNKISFPTKFVLTGLPGIGKTTSLYYIAKQFDLEVISTEILINYYIFNDDLSNRERFNYEKYWKDVDLYKLYNDSIPYYTQYSRKIFEKLSDNSEYMKHIRDLACKIGLELVEGSDGKALLDIGGKEALTNLYYVLKQEGYKSIFITTEGYNEDEIFENYLELYKKDENLCNESRRNIKKLAIKKDVNNNNKKVENIDTKSKEFHDSLRNLIFNPRYKYYNRRRDYKIIRKQTDDIATTVLKILEVLFSE